jgi:small GTP-binding protein
LSSSPIYMILSLLTF